MNTTLTFSLPFHPQPLTLSLTYVESVVSDAEANSEPPTQRPQELGSLGPYTLHSTHTGALWASKVEVFDLATWSLIMASQHITFALLCSTYPRLLVMQCARRLDVSTLNDGYANIVGRELQRNGISPLTEREQGRLRRTAVARDDELEAIGRVLLLYRKDGEAAENYRARLTETEELVQVNARRADA